MEKNMKRKKGNKGKGEERHQLKSKKARKG
jgi:hypothetical protein